MNLKSQLENKLQEVNQKLSRVQEAYTSCSQLIESYFIKELIDNEINRLFALKKIELEKIKDELNKLSSYYKAVENYKTIIMPSEKNIMQVLVFLNELGDQFGFLVAELKTFSLYLENRLKEI